MDVIQQVVCPVIIGREREVTLLEDALLAANRGEGQIVVLAGEAGLGKTRLAGELGRRADKLGMAVLTGACSEAELSLPYLPFLEAIGNHLATTDLEHVREALGPVRRELAHLFPQLEPDQSLTDSGDSTQAKLRLFEGVLALLRVAADAHGLLLVVEDLHWADASTRELLDYMSRRLRGTRIMLLGTYRSDELHRKHPLLPTVQGWRRAGTAYVIDLEPLSPIGVADMVLAIFDQPIRTEFRDFLHARSEGNPFVLEELLKAALDRGDIFRTPERWERKELSEMKLPRTVQDTILLRVERLSDAQADILRTAAVLGPSFSYQTLAAVSGQSDDVVQAALHACVQQQLMEEEPNTSERYRFRHALTREAIYEDMIAPRRRRLHAAAADALRALPGTQAVDLAYHLLASGQVEEAVPVCIKAAEDAERQRGFREAAELYARVLSRVSKDRLLTGQLLCRIGFAYLQDGDAAKAPGYLQEGIALLEALDQRREAARYRLALGRCQWWLARPDLAQMEYERARQMLEVDGPSADLAVAYVRLAGLRAFDVDGPASLELAKRAVSIAEAAGADMPRIWAYNFVGLAISRAGRFEEGIEWLDRSYREAQERDLWWVAANALGNATHERMANFQPRAALQTLRQLGGYGGEYGLFDTLMAGYGLQLLGEPAQARDELQRGLVLATDAGSSHIANRLRRAIATAHASLRDFETAQQLLSGLPSKLERQDEILWDYAMTRTNFDAGNLQQATVAAEAALARFRWDRLQIPEEVWTVDQAVEVLLAAGKAREAQAAADHLRATGLDLNNPHLMRIEGRLALAAGDIDTASNRLKAAADFFAQVEYLEDGWRTRRALADAYVRRGDQAGAETELRLVLMEAHAHGHAFEADAARKALLALGVDVTMAEPQSGGGASVGPTSERLITVMFADIRGYTAMTTGQSPADTADTVTSFHRWVRQEIERHHGLVDKFAGDAVMASFNLTGARLDHCLQALQAGLAVRDKAMAGGLPVGLGIAVGAAVVGQLTEGANLSAIGDVTNLASRLQGAAAAGDIVLSEEAHRRVRQWLGERELVAQREMIELKGFESPVTVYRLPAPTRARSKAGS